MLTQCIIYNNKQHAHKYYMILCSVCFLSMTCKNVSDILYDIIILYTTDTRFSKSVYYDYMNKAIFPYKYFPE